MRPIDADALRQSYLDTDKNAETIKWQEDKLKAGEDNDFFFGFYTAVEIFRDLINEAPTVNEWISVRERLPEEDGEYLAGRYGSDEVVLVRFTRDCFGMDFRLLDPEKEHRPAFYYEDDEWGTCEWEDVECWMPKPVPPKEAP